MKFLSTKQTTKTEHKHYYRYDVIDKVVNSGYELTLSDGSKRNVVLEYSPLSGHDEVKCVESGAVYNPSMIMSYTKTFDNSIKFVRKVQVVVVFENSKPVRSYNNLFCFTVEGRLDGEYLPKTGDRIDLDGVMLYEK